MARYQWKGLHDIIDLMHTMHLNWLLFYSIPSSKAIHYTISKQRLPNCETLIHRYLRLANLVPGVPIRLIYDFRLNVNLCDS